MIAYYGMDLHIYIEYIYCHPWELCTRKIPPARRQIFTTHPHTQQDQLKTGEHTAKKSDQWRTNSSSISISQPVATTIILLSTTTQFGNLKLNAINRLVPHVNIIK